MEPDADFNLEDAIANWIDELASQPGLSDDNLRELESHLREAIAVQFGGGATEAAAFPAAVARIGSSTQIVQEFAKENITLIWQRRIFWMALAAFVIPALVYLPFTLLNIFGRWLTWSGHIENVGEWQLIMSWGGLFGPGLALVIGLLAALARGKNPPLAETIGWLKRNPFRLFLIVTIPAILCLAGYMVTNQASLIWLWLKNQVSEITLVLVFLTLPSWTKVNWTRACVNWLIASRLRLTIVLVLVLGPRITWWTVYLFQAEASNRQSLILSLADNEASTLAVQLVLVASVLALQSSTTTRKKLADKLPSGTAVHFTAADNIFWQERVRWMCAGCLFLWAWGVLDFGLHELMTRGIDRVWFRGAITLSVPLLLSGWLWRSTQTRHSLNMLNGLAGVLTRSKLVVTLALIFAGLQLAFSCLRVGSSAILYVAGIGHALNAFQIWLMELIWPAAMLGFFLWLNARSRNETVAAEPKPH